MFKKKKTQDDNNATYFIGGTAVGMAAGLLLGKVLSRTSIVRTQNFELEAPVKKSTNKDNKEQSKEDPTPTTSFEAMNSDFENNINDLAVQKKYNKNLQKVLYNNNNRMLHNISVEDNIGYNLSSKIYLEDCKKEKKDIIWQFSESSSVKREPFYVDELECNAEYDTRDKDYSETTNTKNSSNSNKKNTLRQVTVYKNIELSETFNNLSNDFYNNNNNTIYENLPNIKPSMINLNILPSYLVNASSMATCNDTFLQFEDEEDDKIVSYKSFDEFNEIDVLSSTKQNYLEN
ncbi:uncharacterized protein LOC117606261 isoform X1 [Osmia lignaria lignaria]|uniref:uncharacterized protein LOC117606261 isoform X1 n=1 Tax=Osmia lignaria lignaria TaxID=1437193 RepID=UPI00402B6B4C